MIKLLLVAGARPNFMKVAPLIGAIRAYNSNRESGNGRVDCILVHTGQHYDKRMSDIFFAELGIPAPDINLAVGSGTHAVQTANVMAKFEPVCERQKPDWVVVVGDVNSTLACTLVASKLGVKVAHLEAGLRSFDHTMPEEINRIVTDALADLLLTPSTDADENLRREGIPATKIRLVGNIMIDALIANLPQAHQNDVVARLGLKKRNFIYVTLHRPSNVDAPENLANTMGALGRLAEQIPIVFPMHPRTRKMLVQGGPSVFDNSSLRLLEPVGYHDSLCLTENARLVLTDSGGLQEESTFFRTPCLTLRANTERPITIRIGSNRLTSVRELESAVGRVLNGPERCGTIPPFWDGKTAERTLQSLLHEDRG
jgi:UDP-N-acetylglucosamine 2-epimerase (non-hydrolysing)